MGQELLPVCVMGISGSLVQSSVTVLSDGH